MDYLDSVSDVRETTMFIQYGLKSTTHCTVRQEQSSLCTVIHLFFVAKI